MLQSFRLRSLLMGGCIIAIGAGSIGWFRPDEKTDSIANLQDTIPKIEKKIKSKEDKTIITGDIDQSLKQMNEALRNLEQQLQNKEWGKIQEKMEEPLQKINLEKAEQAMQEQLKNIDVEKIRIQAEEAFRKVDMEKMQREIQKALAEAKYNIDSKKMQIEMQKAMEESKKAIAELKEIDMERINAEFERAKEEIKKEKGMIKEEMEKATNEIKEFQLKDLKKELEKAKEGIHRSKVELESYKAMLSEMEKDGLLNTKENYAVEYNHGELTINGKKQPPRIAEKYRHFFKRDKVTIRKEEGDDDKTIHL